MSRRQRLTDAKISGKGGSDAALMWLPPAQAGVGIFAAPPPRFLRLTGE
jgi:hypothetical protein